MAGKKVTFTMPSDLVRTVKRLPAGKRSAFVARAIERELDRLATAARLRRLRGKAAGRNKRSLGWANLYGLGRGLWEGEDAQAYVKRLREGRLYSVRQGKLT